MSEFTVPVVRVGAITKHPGADTLSLTQVCGENVIIKTGDFQEGDLAVYVPVDAIVPASVPGTEFLDQYHRRIRAVRLRKVYSEGLLLPIRVLPQRDGLQNPHSGQFVNWAIDYTEGQDVAGVLGITKYEEAVPEQMGGGDISQSEPRPPRLTLRYLRWALARRFFPEPKNVLPNPGVPFYDIEPYKRYSHLLMPGERVIITEKLHGTNSRFCFINGSLYVGSRNNFWADDQPRPLTRKERFAEWVRCRVLKGRPRSQRKPNLYWRVARMYRLEQSLATVPGIAVYGEIFGDVQDLKYGHAAGDVSLRVFDMYDTQNKRWLDWDDTVSKCRDLDLNVVPVLYDGPFTEETLGRLVEAKSALDDKTIREGVVVKPAYERLEDHFGRPILKWVSQSYKLRRGGTEMH